MRKLLALFFVLILTTGAGYQGALPDLEAEMSYKIKSKKVNHPPVNTGEKEPVLQPVLKEDKEYVDIIIKKSRTSEYVKDIQPVIALLEKFKTYIEDDKNIQMFNAIASNYIDHAYYIQKKYQERPEKYYASYRAMVSLAEQTRETAAFMSESFAYNKYLPYSAEGQKYSKANLRNNSEQLLKKIYDTIFVLKNLD